MPANEHIPPQITIDDVNQLAQTFQDASDCGDASIEFERLLCGYKALFGNTYEMFLHAIYHHHSANFYDYLDEHIQKAKKG